jgi:hypothetical protein
MTTIWLAVDEDGDEYVYEQAPRRREWVWFSEGEWCCVPKGTIKKLIGRDLTWQDEPVEYSGEEE